MEDDTPWDDIARVQYNRDKLRYPTDLTHKEWEVIAPFLLPNAQIDDALPFIGQLGGAGKDRKGFVITEI